MKRRVLVVLCTILALGTSAFADEPYQLAFHADPDDASSCELAVVTPGLLRVHVTVKGQGGPLGGVNFKAIKPACMNSAVWIVDAWQWPTVVASGGDTQWEVGGVDVIVDCAPVPPNTFHYLPVYLGYILFSVSEPVDPCCFYEPAATRDRPAPVLIMCQTFHIEEPMTPKKVVMNANQSCRCDLPLAVEATTWGAVKALYR